MTAAKMKRNKRKCRQAGRQTDRERASGTTGGEKRHLV